VLRALVAWKQAGFVPYPQRREQPQPTPTDPKPVQTGKGASMSTIPEQNGQITTYCCHPSTAVHTTETALLATLITEHKVLTDMLDYPSGSDQIIGLLRAHSGAEKSLAAWRTAISLSPV
jgi:hypothetical protein